MSKTRQDRLDLPLPRGYAQATRNTRDFSGTGIELVNPFGDQRRAATTAPRRGVGDTAGVLDNRLYTRASMAIGAAGLRLAGKLSVPVYRATGGRLFGKIGTAPVLLLTTTGRRTGQQRTAPVVYMPDGERLIVIGSNAGNARAPAWALNLEARPEAEVEIGRERRPVRARIAEGAERGELWKRMNEEWYEGFDDYAQRTDRDIRLFVLEPR